MKNKFELGDPMTQEKDSEEEESGWLLGLLKFAPKFYWSSIPLILNLICPAVLNISSLIFFGWYKDAALSAGFGLSITLYLWFFLIPQATNCEIVGIQCSKANGAQDYKLMRLTFLRATLSNFCIVIYALIAYFFAADLLVAIGMEPNISHIAHLCILWQAPAICLQAFNEILKSYMISLGYYAPLLWLNLGLALSYPLLTYLLIWECRLGIYGFAIIAMLRETVDF
jgi:Na+-driven multidrug efflux pump